MRNLKCIGGPCDGEIHAIEDHVRHYDLVRIPLIPNFVLSDFAQDVQDFRHGRVPEHVVTRYTIYRIEKLSFHNDGIMEFLVHQDLSIKQAIIRQFEK